MMLKKISVVLEQSEYSALLEMAIDDLRNPSDELRQILRSEISKRLSTDKAAETVEQKILIPKELAI